MPRNAIASRRYATALFELVHGEGDGKLGEVLAELHALEASVQKDQLIDRFLSNPVLSREEKLESLHDLEKVLPNTYRFIVVLVEAGRFDLISDIVQTFEKMCEEATGELSVTVETARSLPENVMNDIQRLLEERWSKQIKMKVQVNPEIIGGFLATGPGRIIDGSVRSQLEGLRQRVAD